VTTGQPSPIGATMKVTNDYQRDIITFHIDLNVTRHMLTCLNPAIVNDVASVLSQKITHQLTQEIRKQIGQPPMQPDYFPPKYKQVVQDLERQLEKHQDMHYRQVQDHIRAEIKQKSGTFHDPNQQSIFDALNPEDWGDARPFEKSPLSMAEMREKIYATENQIKSTKEMIDFYKKQQTQDDELLQVELTCPWCGHAAESVGDLGLHEEGCAP